MQQDKGQPQQMPQKEDNRTRITHSADSEVALEASASAPSDAAVDDNHPSHNVPLNENDANFHALTRINQVFQAQHSEHGFRRAQNDVNESLAEQEILLNKRFVLISVIGAGGMGTVYKARDIRKVEAQDSNPYVAVKVLNSDFRKHPDAFISLQREASRSHLLSHPNIVTVHDFDRDGNTIYMTMELLKGEALDDFLHSHRESGVESSKAFEIVSQICEALEFAHRKGIIHSDLKPANIFISEEGVKILDFGIARLAASSQYQDKFDAGTIGAVTPGYASLEMLEKKAPDASDDVYAAAIITYELLSGRHPYGGKSAAAALGLKLEPQKLDGLSSRQWRALSSALQLKREQRTASIKEFHRGLTETFHWPIFRIVSLVLFLMVAWFSYSRFLVPDELSQFVEQTMAKAQQCYQQQDFFCAISSINAVIKIDPQNQQAQQLLNEAEEAQRQQESEAAIARALAEARSCLESGRFQCVLEQTEQVLAQNPDNIVASGLSVQAAAGLDKQRQEQAVEEASFAEKMQLATVCQEKKDYACAIDNAKLALTIKNDDTEASALLQNASYAQQQQRENLQKANKILQDGEVCLKKLNYSCAIAKSESALEFVPGHRQALAMKKQAEKAIANLKKKIEIE